MLVPNPGGKIVDDFFQSFHMPCRIRVIGGKRQVILLHLLSDTHNVDGMVADPGKAERIRGHNIEDAVDCSDLHSADGSVHKAEVQQGVQPAENRQAHCRAGNVEAPLGVFVNAEGEDHSRNTGADLSLFFPDSG